MPEFRRLGFKSPLRCLQPRQVHGQSHQPQTMTCCSTRGCGGGGQRHEQAAMQSLMDSLFPEGEDHDPIAGEDGRGTADLSTADEVDSAMQDALASESATATMPASALVTPTQGMELAQVSALSGDDFVRFFSRINIYQTNNASFDRSNEEEVRKNIASGNSRDPPSPWLYYCSKACGHSSFSVHYVNEHERNCAGQPRVKTCMCPREGCGKVFKNDATMKSHVASDHDFIPTACELCPDQADVLYETKLKYKNHREKVHSDPIEETLCPLAHKCMLEQKFTSKRALKKHLKSKHGLTTEELQEHVRDARLDRTQKPGRKNKPKGWHLGPRNGDGRGMRKMQVKRLYEAWLNSKSTFYTDGRPRLTKSLVCRVSH